MPPERARNPFVGPVPFARKDAELFFGRGAEIQELVSLIVANRVVVLYAASGAGKTSLLNAGVLPLLERRERFEVLPSARFSRVAPDDEAARDAANVYVYTTLLNWRDEDAEPPEDQGDTDEAPTTLSAFLAAREARHDPRGRRLPRVVVFDQFEEIFTVHPEHWEQRDGFFEQLAAALDADRHLHVLLSLREDYLAQLEPTLPMLLTPGEQDEPDLGPLVPLLRPQVRYRLERLGSDAAIDAVTGPVQGAGRTFSPGVAEELVRDLQKLRIDVGLSEPIETPGEYVEPVQLQVVCHSLWNDLPADVEKITAKHIRAFGNVDEVLERFYDDAVKAAAKAAHTGEERLRKWLEEAFITSLGTRNTIYRAVESKARFPDAAIDELEDRHLIRGDWRAGTRWYELTHDRFIGPIQSSNHRAASERSRRLRKRVAVFAAVAIPLAVVAAGWGAFAQDEPVARFGTISAGALDLNVPLALYEPPRGATFTRVGEVDPTPGPDPTPQGNRLAVLVATQGYRGRPLVIRTSTVPPTGRAGAGAVSLRFTPPTDQEKRRFRIWIPVPAGSGRFRYRASLEDADSGVVINQARSAYFRVRPNGMALTDRALFLLQLRKDGGGQGSVESVPKRIACGRVCSFQYEVGTKVSLVARPGPLSAFRRWMGGCKEKGRGNVCAVLVERPTTVVADFLPLDIVTTRGGKGVFYRKSARLDDTAPGLGPDDDVRVSIYCYTKGELAYSAEGGKLRASDDWAKIVLKPTRFVPAVFLRRSRDGRIRGVPDC